MKVYEYLAEAGHDLLASYITSAGMAAQAAKALEEAHGCPTHESALFLAVAARIAGILDDEAKIRPQYTRLLDHVTEDPTTIHSIMKTYQGDKRKIYREIKKLIREGLVVKVSNKKYALAPAPQPEPQPDEVN